MARLVLELTKSIDENAAAYFEKAKKAKKKTEGAEKALNESLRKLHELELKKEKITLEKSKQEKSRERKAIGEKKKEEAADATCTFSRAWKLGLQTSSVFYVNPEQVSKKTKAGEYMGKGAFMIYCKANYIGNKVNLAVGINANSQIMAGPVDAIKTHCGKYVVLIQGNEKASAVAKYIRHKIGGTIDEIIRALPSGGFRVNK